MIITVILLAILLVRSESSIGIKIFGSIIFSSVLLFLLYPPNFWNENIEIDDDALRINQRIGKEKYFPFDQIRRVVIRAEPRSMAPTQFSMTIFGPGKSSRIIASALIDSDRLIQLMEENGKQYGFKVIHQDASGRILNV